jgi:2-methylcitrate dehydratase PrpD
MTVEAQLAEYMAALTFDDVDDAARGALGRLLLDTAAVAIAGFREADCRPLATALCVGDRGGAASLVGAEMRVSPPAAAFANGVYAHWCEWDDTHDPSHVHASAAVFPALLAAFEAAGGTADGAEFAAAAVAAFDGACRVGALLKPYCRRGWMPTGTGGAVGAAAGAARLLGLGAAGIHSAMGIAAAGGGLSRQPVVDRVNGKNILAGVAAKVGVEAALLARAGAVGAPNFLTGPYGLQALYADGKGNAADVLDGLGSRFSVAEVSLKPYPCPRSMHPALDLVFELVRENPGAAEVVESVCFKVPNGVHEYVGRPFALGDNPRTAALFSLPYTAAVALRTGAVVPADFAPETVRRVACEEAGLIGGIVVEAVPVAGDAADPFVPTTAHFRLRNGAEIARTTHAIKGAPDHPMSAAEEAQKLSSAVADSLSPADVEALAKTAREVAERGVAPLLDLLRRVAA